MSQPIFDESSVSPRDNYMFMLHERIEALEDYMREMQSYKADIVMLGDKLRCANIRNVISEYKRIYSNTIGNHEYYLTLLGESLRLWVAHRSKEVLLEYNNEDAIMALMSRFLSNVTSMNSIVVLDVGRIFIGMSCEDIEDFQLWDQLPDMIESIDDVGQEF